MKDPFIRDLNSKIGAYKSDMSRENVIEAMKSVNGFVKNLTGGLDIEDKILEYEKVTSGQAPEQPKQVDSYNYSLAKNKTDVAPKQQESIIPKGIADRSV